MGSVLIVDDHAGFRASAARMLSSHGHEVVGQASDGPEAVRMAAELRPQVILLDIGLPESDGFEVAGAIAGSDPGIAIVLVSSRPRDEVEPLLASAPVAGFIPKDELSAQAVSDLID